MGKNIVKEFFEIKFLQLLTEVLTANYRKIAYTQDEVGELSLFVEYETLNDVIVDRLQNFVMEHYKELDNLDLNEEALKPENKVTLERQQELSKELLDKAYTMDDIANIITGIQDR